MREELEELYRQYLQMAHVAGKEARQEAKELFPTDEKRRNIWIRLARQLGGIVPAVEMCGLEKDYEDYLVEFNEHCDKGWYEAASLCVSSFKDFCRKKLIETYNP